MIPDSVEKQAGQVLLTGFAGLTAPAALLEAAGRGAIAGCVLFGRNVGSASQVRALNEELVRAFPADMPPWIAVDQEGGRVARLKRPVVTLPPMRTLGAHGDAGLAREAALLLGRQLCALGFNLNFAPVMDVDTNPDNPVIGDRSFGDDPAHVAAMARAFARGLEDAGVAACAKHFPGHGDTTLDSHLALPRVAHPRSRLEAVELYPFRHAAGACTGVMTAHVVFDALDADAPATLSRAIVTDLLRTGLDYRGVIFSDDLEMRAIADRHGIPAAATAAIAAGCDSVLVCSRFDVLDEVRAALALRARDEPAFAARLADAANRSLAARSRFRAQPVAADALGAALDPETTASLEATLRGLSA